jgi:hypothetical protein
MNKKIILLLLTDHEIILFQESQKTSYCLENTLEDIQEDLKRRLSVTAQCPYYLLIDRSTQEIREEEMPLLWVWDRWRFIHHKKQDWIARGEIYGYRFFKQNKRLYLQWTTLSPHDPLRNWIPWLHSLPHPFLGIYFASLEAGNFLMHHFSPPPEYGILVYQLSSSHARHVIFQGKRLLLFRPVAEEEDLKSSLYFLSRTHPDMHHKIQGLAPNASENLTFLNNFKEIEADHFIHFLLTQKPRSLSLTLKTSAQNLWLKRALFFTFLVLLGFSGFVLIQILDQQTKIHHQKSQIALLKTHLDKQKIPLENKNIGKLRKTLASFHYLQTQQKTPFPLLEKLSPLIAHHSLKLEKLIWEDQTSLELVFTLPQQPQEDLSKHFKVLLQAFQHTFPQSALCVIEAPFHSSPHETYTYPPETLCPVSHLRLEYP